MGLLGEHEQARPGVAGTLTCLRSPGRGPRTGPPAAKPQAGSHVTCHMPVALHLPWTGLHVPDEAPAHPLSLQDQRTTAEDTQEREYGLGPPARPGSTQPARCPALPLGEPVRSGQSCPAAGPLVRFADWVATPHQVPTEQTPCGGLSSTCGRQMTVLGLASLWSFCWLRWAGWGGGGEGTVARKTWLWLPAPQSSTVPTAEPCSVSSPEL